MKKLLISMGIIFMSTGFNHAMLRSTVTLGAKKINVKGCAGHALLAFKEISKGICLEQRKKGLIQMLQLIKKARDEGGKDVINRDVVFDTIEEFELNKDMMQSFDLVYQEEANEFQKSIQKNKRFSAALKEMLEIVNQPASILLDTRSSSEDLGQRIKHLVSTLYACYTPTIHARLHTALSRAHKQTNEIFQENSSWLEITQDQKKIIDDIDQLIVGIGIMVVEKGIEFVAINMGNIKEYCRKPFEKEVVLKKIITVLADNPDFLIAGDKLALWIEEYKWNSYSRLIRHKTVAELEKIYKDLKEIEQLLKDAFVKI